MPLIPSPTLFLRGTTTSGATPTCTTAIPDKNGYVPPEACNANYGFYPKWEDNMVFAIAFALTTAAHLTQAIVYKKKFCWVITMGASWESICFILRTLGAKDQQNSNYVMMSTLFFLLAPLWINAFAYMVVARLVYFLDGAQKVLRVRATYLAKAFVSADVVCFLVQAVGGALMAGGQDNPKNADLGKKIYMVGCGIQLGFVAAFVVVVAAFYRTISQDIRTGTEKTRNRWIRPLLWVIFLVLILIVERIIFRLIEFSRGASNSNPMLRKEWFQLYLDGLPMLIALVALNVVHPALVLKGPESNMPSTKWACCGCRKKEKFGPLPLQSMDSVDRITASRQRSELSYHDHDNNEGGRRCFE